MDEGGHIVRYISVMSLKSTVVIKIASKLWELQCSQKGIDFTYAAYSQTTMQSKILEGLFSLPLPKQLKQDIAQYLTTIGQHLLGWLAAENFDLGNRALGHICWTNEGTVDAGNTIRSIFSCHREDQSMFTAISKACLEDLVVDAWSRMPEYKKNVNSNYNNSLCMEHRYNYHFVMYWICFCNDELSRLVEIIKNSDDSNIYHHSHSVSKNMFDLSVWTANELAAKYFWQKLTEQEKSANIMVWIDHLIKNIESLNDMFVQEEYGFVGILYFLLGQMDDCKQQRQIFHKYGEEILESLLFVWPWQKYLLETICVMFPYIEESVYVEFMSNFILTIHGGSMASELFREVWCASPLSLKHRFMEDTISDSGIGPILFDRLLNVNDFDSLKLIMNFASSEVKKELVFCGIQSKNFICYAIKNLVCVDQFLREMLSSETDICLCKRLLMKYLESYSNRWFLHSMDKEALEDFRRWCLNFEVKIS